jgi:hypothetical protein
MHAAAGWLSCVPKAGDWDGNDVALVTRALQPVMQQRGASAVACTRTLHIAVNR